jgi:uncharacterized protein (DUF433 family)
MSTVTADSVPLSTVPDGVIRVSGTRVTLDIVVAAFLQGATAEAIADQYPSVPLADVYTILGHYLRHRVEVDRYLAGRRQQAAAVRQENEAAADPTGIRARLLARRPTQG